MVTVAGPGSCGSGGSCRDWRGALGSRWLAGVKVGDVGLARQWELNVVVLKFYLYIVCVDPWDSEDEVLSSKCHDEEFDHFHVAEDV